MQGHGKHRPALVDGQGLALQVPLLRNQLAYVSAQADDVTLRLLVALRNDKQAALQHCRQRKVDACGRLCTSILN